MATKPTNVYKHIKVRILYYKHTNPPTCFEGDAIQKDIPTTKLSNQCTNARHKVLNVWFKIYIKI
jgi:hypothetical protein